VLHWKLIQQLAGVRVGKKKQLNLSAEVQVTVLLAEYRAVYDLALFRLASLDRRVPLTGSALAASLGAVLVLPPQAQLFVLIALPLALVWLLRTTANHARSFEDALRRIEEIEKKVNALSGDELIRFQSRHPSRGKATGGRTSRETIAAVLIASGLLLLGCAWMALTIPLDPPVPVLILCYCGYVGLYLLAVAARLRCYRYGHTAAEES
jgi:hypothetical protein